MMIPLPHLPRRWSDYPATLALVAANVLIYFLFFAHDPGPAAVDHLSDRDLRTAGRLFLLDSNLKSSWLTEAPVRRPERLETYGTLALRDGRFLESLRRGAFFDVAGDPVALKSLTVSARRFHDELQDRALHRFGLSSERRSGLAWLTYQFSHANAFHLLSNLVFLILLGFALEARLGGAGLSLLYVIGGVAGGIAYLQADPFGVIPMVGASGSVSAMIAAYPILETRRRIRYYYFILPFRGQHGLIHLPTLLIFPLFLVSDVAALIASPVGLSGGIAYSAHVGGAVFGALAAICLVLIRGTGPASPEEDLKV